MNKQTVGIFGIGAIGSVMAKYICDASKIQLYCFNRTPRTGIKIVKNGATADIDIPIYTESNTNKIKLDWLIICLKEYHYKSAAIWLKRLVSNTNKIAVIRNGLHLKDSLLHVASEDQILECTIDCPTQKAKNGYYDQLREAVLTVPQNELGRCFKRLLEGISAEIRMVSDYHTVAWKKVCETSALGSILCLTGRTCEVFKDSTIKNLYRNLLDEMVNVANADGALIEQNFIEKCLENTMGFPSTKGSSMLSDRNGGRPIELMAKNGIISKMAIKHQIATPLNDAICVLLNQINK